MTTDQERVEQAKRSVFTPPPMGGPLDVPLRQVRSKKREENIVRVEIEVIDEDFGFSEKRTFRILMAYGGEEGVQELLGDLRRYIHDNYPTSKRLSP